MSGSLDPVRQGSLDVARSRFHCSSFWGSRKLPGPTVMCEHMQYLKCMIYAWAACPAPPLPQGHCQLDQFHHLTIALSYVVLLSQGKQLVEHRSATQTLLSNNLAVSTYEQHKTRGFEAGSSQRDATAILNVS